MGGRATQRFSVNTTDECCFEMVLMKQAVEAENNMLMVYNSPARILRVFMVEM